MISPGDIEAIERATLAGLGCDPAPEMPAWLLPRINAPMGRAKSAVPVRHDAPADRSLLEMIEASYREAGLEPAFRMADAPGLGATKNLLAAMGFGPGLRPTHVMIAELTDVTGVSDLSPTLGKTADRDWISCFAGPGFDPDEGRDRVAVLSGARNTLFGKMTWEVQAAAVGVGNYNHGWVSIHGMRTAVSHRGQGLAAAILAELARAGLERGLSRAVLQVEEGNWSALNLYRRAGFRSVWRYDYWKSDPVGQARD